MTSETPLKPRRKKLEVPIHGEHDETLRKTYSANFNSRRHKFRHEDRKLQEQKVDGFDAVTQQISRKYLSKENARLVRENEEILAKFNELEELSVKKITKLKEKMATLQNVKEEIAKENVFLSEQSEELTVTIEDLRVQLELSKFCRTCEELKACIEKCSNDNNELRKSNKDLEEDVNMLKTVVFRLNLQLERYQDKLRKLNVKVTTNFNGTNSDGIVIIDVPNDPSGLSQTHNDHTHTPISWGKVNAHTLGPLLDAYQDTIGEKEEIILNYDAELSNFTGKLKQIMEENELLHKNLTEDEECSAKLRIELESLKKELQGTKSQNDVLIKKCSVKQDKLEEVLRCYESKVGQMKRDYAVVHEQYFKGRTEVVALREKIKALTDSQDDFKNERSNYIPISVHNSSVSECKRWYEELKHQYEQEKVKLKETMEAQAVEAKELYLKISTLSKEKEEIDSKMKQLEKHIKKSESKYLELEHTLNEVQLSRSACRKQLHKAMGFAKDLVSEQESLLQALNQRQQENKVVKKIGSDMATRMDSLRSQLKEAQVRWSKFTVTDSSKQEEILKDVQKEAWQELTTVERRMQEQDNVIEKMKREHDEEIERLQNIIRDKEGNNLLLKEQTTLPIPHYLLFRDKHK